MILGYIGVSDRVNGDVYCTRCAEHKLSPVERAGETGEWAPIFSNQGEWDSFPWCVWCREPILDAQLTSDGVEDLVSMCQVAIERELPWETTLRNRLQDYGRYLDGQGRATDAWGESL